MPPGDKKHLTLKANTLTGMPLADFSMSALKRIVQKVSTFSDLNILFNYLFIEIADIINFQFAGASLFNEDLNGIVYEQFSDRLGLSEDVNMPLIYNGASFKATPLQEIIKINRTTTHELSFWTDRFPATAEYNNNVENFEHQLFLPLLLRGQLLGMLVFYNDQPFGVEEQEFELLDDLGRQLALVTRLITSAQQIQIVEDEKKNLLAISNSIVSVQDKQGLLKLVLFQLKKLLPFDIVRIDIANSSISNRHNLLHHASQEIMSHPDYEAYMSATYDYNDGLFDHTLDHDGPILWHVPDMLEWSDTPAYVKFLNDNQIVNATGISLREKGIPIATVFFFSKEEEMYGQKQLELIRDIAYQLSVAVSNILTNEKLEASAREKAVLFALSNDLAAIRDRGDLLEIINVNLKRLFPAAAIAIRVIDQIQQTHSVYFTDPKSELLGYPGFAEMLLWKNPICDGVFDRIIESEGPVILDLEELVSSGNAPNYQQFNYELGIRETLNIALRTGDNAIGLFTVFAIQKGAFKPVHENLVTGIAHQLSIAVANILANEELQQKESEKSTLLAFNNAVSNIRSKEDLFQVVVHKLGLLFPNLEFAISFTGTDGNSHHFFVCNVRSAYAIDPRITELSGLKFDTKDSVFACIPESDEPFVLSLIRPGPKNKFPAYLEPWSSAGMSEVVISPLWVGEDLLGVLWAFSKNVSGIPENRFTLLGGVSAQLSVVTSNIFAYQQIRDQLLEIEGYKQQLQDEKQYLVEEIETTYNYTDIIGSSAEMRKVFHLVEQVAPTDSTVLILGETGTGKELIARAIHNASKRREKLMVKVNCATLPANLIESELFGHERGSFTGATDRRIGKFELANRGTLFLDEVGELPLDLQVKLLRALQEKEIERVGGRTIIKTDVRIIAATNRNLYQEVQAGRFRSDLFFRLDVFPVTLPPLRERKEDIRLLTLHFITKLSRKTGKNVNNITASALQNLLNYSWPGNVRELEHLIERSILLSPGAVLNHIMMPVTGNSENQQEMSDHRVKTIDEIEREHIMMVLKKCRGRVAGPGGAAEMLMIPSTTLNSKIKRLGIKKTYLME